MAHQADQGLRVTVSVGDLVRVRLANYVEVGIGIVVDEDPSDLSPTYYLVSVAGNTPDWYHEDEVFEVIKQPVKE